MGEIYEEKPKIDISTLFPFQYEEILADAINELQDPKKSSTGIEESLCGRFMDEMIKLQKFINTTASTNYPHNKYFQGMFLCGFIHKSLVTKEFLEFLESKNLSYVLYQTNYCCERQQPKEHLIPKIVHRYETLDSIKKDFIGRIFLHYEAKTLNNRKYLGHIIESMQSELERLKNLSFNEAYEHLIKNEIVLETFNEYLTKFLKHDVIPIVQEPPEKFAKNNASNYCCKINELIRSGEILSLAIENSYDLWDRDMYVTILDYFNENYI